MKLQQIHLKFGALMMPMKHGTQVEIQILLELFSICKMIVETQMVRGTVAPGDRTVYLG